MDITVRHDSPAVFQTTISIGHHHELFQRCALDGMVFRPRAERKAPTQAGFSNAGISHNGACDALQVHAFCRLVSTRVFIHRATNGVIA